MKRYSRAVMVALDGSIEKWRGIYFNGECDTGANNCPLCQLLDDEVCRGSCPIADNTELSFCKGTPYDDWAGYLGGRHGEPEWKVFDERSEELAWNMLKFLMSLRQKLHGITTAYLDEK